MSKSALFDYRENGVKVGYIPFDGKESECLKQFMTMPRTVQEILYKCPMPGFFMDVTITVYDLLSVQRNKTLVIPMPDRNYGSRDNGVWSGLIGNLSRNEIDSTLAIMTPTTERMEVTDFSQGFLQVTTGFLTRYGCVADASRIK